MTDREAHYIRSLFRCPICGTVVGCDMTGKIALFGRREFRKHVLNCRKHGVKPVIERQREGDHE